MSGETRNCKGCRYWSEMIAGNIHNNGGEIEAMCLSPISPARGRYKGPQHACGEWASGHLGAVDEVGSDPLRYEQERSERRPLFDPNNPSQGYCSDAEWAARRDAALSSQDQASFQQRMYARCIACFGEQITRDKVERNHRFLEEALELVQALGCTSEEAH